TPRDAASDNARANRCPIVAESNQYISSRLCRRAPPIASSIAGNACSPSRSNSTRLPATKRSSKPRYRLGILWLSPGTSNPGMEVGLPFRARDDDGAARVAEDVDGRSAHVEHSVDGHDESDPLDRQSYRGQNQGDR